MAESSQSSSVLSLRRLSVNDGDDIYDLLSQIPAEEQGFHNTASGISREHFPEWLASLDRMSRGEGLEEGIVPQTTFWLCENGKPVGCGKIRHHLTDRLANEGGHISLGIIRSERGHGLARRFIPMLIDEAKKIGIDDILMTVAFANEPGLRCTLAAGGEICLVTSARYYIWANPKPDAAPPDIKGFAL